MITMLLWRCPLCRKDDCLRAHTRRLLPVAVACRACGARWQVRRVPGHDYRLRVVAGPQGAVGLEMTLGLWYELLKAGVTLAPRQVASAALRLGEETYAVDERVRLVVRQGTPLPAPGERPGPPVAWPRGLPMRPLWEAVGEGRLLMTSERLRWETPRGGYDFWWPQVRAAFSFHTLYYGIVYGEVSYRFRPPGQRLLKWLTYTARMAERLAQTTGQKVAVSYH